MTIGYTKENDYVFINHELYEVKYTIYGMKYYEENKTFVPILDNFDKIEVFSISRDMLKALMRVYNDEKEICPESIINETKRQSKSIKSGVDYIRFESEHTFLVVGYTSERLIWGCVRTYNIGDIDNHVTKIQYTDDVEYIQEKNLIETELLNSRGCKCSEITNCLRDNLNTRLYRNHPMFYIDKETKDKLDVGCKACYIENVLLSWTGVELYISDILSIEVISSVPLIDNNFTEISLRIYRNSIMCENTQGFKSFDDTVDKHAVMRQHFVDIVCSNFEEDQLKNLFFFALTLNLFHTDECGKKLAKHLHLHFLI